MPNFWQRLLGKRAEPAPEVRTITINVPASLAPHRDVSSPASPRKPRKVAISTEPGPLMLSGQTSLDVAGPTFHQEALAAVASEWKAAQTNKRLSVPRVTAHLILEPHNPHDPNAVRVEVGGRLVGHLKREDAATYQPLLRALAARNQVAACNGSIRAMAETGTLCLDIEGFVNPRYRLE